MQPGDAPLGGRLAWHPFKEYDRHRRSARGVVVHHRQNGRTVRTVRGTGQVVEGKLFGPGVRTDRADVTA